MPRPRLAIVHAHTFDFETGKGMTDEHYARLDEAARLYHAGTFDKIIVTATHQLRKPHHGRSDRLHPIGPQPGKAFNEMSLDYLLSKGVARKDVLLSPGRLTIEEIAGIRPIIERLKPTELHVVTSDSQIPRAMAIAAAAYPNLKKIAHPIKTNNPPESTVLRDFRNLFNWHRKHTPPLLEQ